MPGRAESLFQLQPIISISQCRINIFQGLNIRTEGFFLEHLRGFKGFFRKYLRRDYPILSATYLSVWRNLKMKLDLFLSNIYTIVVYNERLSPAMITIEKYIFKICGVTRTNECSYLQLKNRILPISNRNLWILVAKGMFSS